MIVLLHFRVTVRMRLVKPRAARAHYYPPALPELDPLTSPRTEYARGPPSTALLLP